VASLRSFAERYAAAWCGGDPASVAAFYSPDGSLCVNENEPAVGREAITEVARGFMSDLPGMEVLMDELVEGERPEFRWTLVGTHSGTGRPVRISGFEEWRIGPDGLIAESLGHFDAEDYRRQVEGS
jgi:hypothetical protein